MSMKVNDLLEMYETYTNMRQGLTGKKEILMDANADFEERLAANAAIGKVNDYRIHFFPFVREHVFGMPNGQASDLKARYVALDDKRAETQTFIRQMVFRDSTKALEAMDLMGADIQTERELVEEAITRIKQYKKK